MCNKSAHPHRLVWGTAADPGDEFHTPGPDGPHWAWRARSWKPTPPAKQSRSPSPAAQAGYPSLRCGQESLAGTWGSHQCPPPNSTAPEDRENYSVPLVTNLNPTCCCFVHTVGRAAAKAHGGVGLITATHWRGSHTHQPSRSSTELCHRRSAFQIYI